VPNLKDASNGLGDPPPPHRSPLATPLSHATIFFVLSYLATHLTLSYHPFSLSLYATHTFSPPFSIPLYSSLVNLDSSMYI
ncbi:hypothetical protein B0F90DRAFT_1777154, partial [Multifurca ochricompacta]